MLIVVFALDDTATPTGRSLLWEVTRFCNLACIHCCTYSGPTISTANDVSTGRMIRIAAELADADVVDVLFSGGEPFLRKDFIEMVRAIDPDRTLVYIASNGTTIDDRIVDQLHEARIAGIDISLDGHTPELHRGLRLHSTSFERAVRGIETCVRGEVPLRVTSCVTPATAPHVGALVDLVAGLGVKTLVIQTILPSGGRAVEHPGLALSPEAIPDIDRQVNGARKRWGEAITVDLRAGATSTAAKGCPAGYKLVNISADGDVSTCSWLYKIARDRFTLGNIKTRSLRDCLSGIDRMMRPWTKLTPGCPIPEVLVGTTATRTVHP